MRDKTGREITVGDYVAYGHAVGRAAGIAFGKVLEVRANGIQTIGCSDDWGRLRLNSRVGVLRYTTTRVLVVNDLIPATHKQLLDTWGVDA